jgi:hypothetical protein
MLLPESHVPHLTDALIRKQQFWPLPRNLAVFIVCTVSQRANLSATDGSYIVVSPEINNMREPSSASVGSEHI